LHQGLTTIGSAATGIGTVTVGPGFRAIGSTPRPDMSTSHPPTSWSTAAGNTAEVTGTTDTDTENTSGPTSAGRRVLAGIAPRLHAPWVVPPRLHSVASDLRQRAPWDAPPRDRWVAQAPRRHRWDVRPWAVSLLRLRPPWDVRPWAVSLLRLRRPWDAQAQAPRPVQDVGSADLLNRSVVPRPRRGLPRNQGVGPWDVRPWAASPLPPRREAVAGRLVAARVSRRRARHRPTNPAPSPCNRVALPDAALADSQLRARP